MMAFLKTPARRSSLLLALCASMLQCSAPIGAYKAYQGEEREAGELALIRGDIYSRLDWLNRYDDTIRFLSVDGTPVENAERYNAIRVTPGTHDIRVYFSWDMGNRRGLAPALVTYAATRETLSRSLRFQVRPGEEYLVKAEPVFTGPVEDITTLGHVDFWVVDSEGEVVVSRDEGRYVVEGRP